MELSLTDWAALAEVIASLAVVISLIYLARQVRQGNILSRYQARQNMMEQDLASLRIQMSDPGITSCLLKENPSEEDLFKLHLFLTSIMRQREWEWSQYKDGIIDEDVYQTYHEVIGIFLGTVYTREWWNNVGRSGLNPEFVKEVDGLLGNRELTRYWDGVSKFISRINDEKNN